MSPRYYARRQLNPFRGVVQVLEVEDASAHSYDGVTWYLRADDGYGWVRPTGLWHVEEGLKAGSGTRHADLLAALASRPALPFPLADRLELWLLDKARGLPLALLESGLPGRALPERPDLEWYPFVLTYQGFRSSTLAADKPALPGGDTPHRHVLARQVNDLARPYPAAQWFYRRPDGSGEGRAGHRLMEGWLDRSLAPEAFPELLLGDGGTAPYGNNLLEQSVINDYHAWVAPFLLQLPGLRDTTRAWLEARTLERPHWLERVYRLLPRMLDAEALQAGLVAARLARASGQTDNDLLGN